MKQKSDRVRDMVRKREINFLKTREKQTLLNVILNTFLLRLKFINNLPQFCFVVPFNVSISN